jgi:hypothetical protein
MFSPFGDWFPIKLPELTGREDDRSVHALRGHVRTNANQATKFAAYLPESSAGPIVIEATGCTFAPGAGISLPFS